MDYFEQDVFLSLARTLHFRKTAEEKNMTPSAVSRLLRRLEEETGQKLIVRYNRRTELTESGIIFRDFCRNSLESYRQLQQQWQPDSGPVSGKLRLFCSVTAAYSVINETLKAFTSAYPAVEILVVTGSVDTALSRIQKDEADLAVAVKPESIPDRLHYRILQKTEVQLIAPAEPFFDKDLLRDFTWGKNRLPWILPEKGYGRSHISRWMKQHKIEPKIAARTSGNEATAALVSMGFGVGLVSDLVLNGSPFRNRIRLLEKPGPIPPYEVILAGKQSRINEPVLSAFLKTAAEPAKEIQ